MGKPKKPVDEVLGSTLGLRLTRDEMERLDALVARIPIASRHSIARAAIRIGMEALESDPRRVVGPAAKKAKRGK